MLTDMFKGRVMGMDTEERIENVGSYESLFTSNTPKKDLFEWGSKKTGDDLVGWNKNKSPKSFNMANIFKTTKNKTFNVENIFKSVKQKKGMNIDSYFKWNKSKSNLGVTQAKNKIDMFLNVRPKHNKKDIKVNDIIGTTRNNKFDIMGWNRIKEQKNLPIFGDVDGDKVLNILDCAPFNKKRHGAAGTMYPEQNDIYTEEDPLEELEEELSKNEPVEPTVTSDEYQYEAQPVEIPMEQPIEEGPSPLTKIRLALGIPTLTEVAQRKQEERRIAQEAYSEAAKNAKNLKAEAQYRQAYEKRLRELYPGVTTLRSRKATKYAIGPSGEIIPLAVPKVQRKRYFDEVLLGASSAASGLTPSGFTTWDYSGKVERLMGLFPSKQPTNYPVTPMTPSAPIMATPSMSSQTPPSRGDMVWSPYSKRYVRYPRGPYRKY